MGVIEEKSRLSCRKDRAPCERRLTVLPASYTEDADTDDGDTRADGDGDEHHDDLYCNGT